MRRLFQHVVCVLCAVFVAAVVYGQGSPERVSVPFRDPSRPGLLKASLINGGITVKGYNGKEVIVEAQTRVKESARAEGMRRILMTGVDLTVEEENNVIKVGTGSPNRTVDLTIQVPFKTSLKLSCINNGNIQVNQVEGEIEANNINGSVTLAGVSGSAVGHSLNGRVLVSFARVDPQKPMSFSTLNGNIDVTFPADVRARVRIKSENGDVQSDFEIAIQDQPARQIVEDRRSEGGKYRIRIDKAIYGTINGGGPEIQFTNLNGAIYIRKAAK